jgi:hypothetical protein
MSTQEAKGKPKLDSKAVTLDKYITGFIEISKEIHDKAFGSMSETLWMTRLTKLQASYVKSKNPMGWAKMFSDFYAIHSDDISKDIFEEVENENTKVNDDWIKDMTDSETKVSTGSRSSSSWGPTSRCIYPTWRNLRDCVEAFKRKRYKRR